MAASDWYARKLGRQRQTAPPQDPRELLFAPATVPGRQVQQQQQPQQDDDAQIIADMTKSAKSQRRAGICPECESGNYKEFRWAGQVSFRCYDCGYPIVQSGSGAGGAGTGQATGPARPAAQVDTVGTWASHGGNFKSGQGVFEHLGPAQ